MANEGIRQHKRMAMGESVGENFGVEPFDRMNGEKMYVEHPDKHDGTESRHLHDHERGARHPIKHDERKMHAQANADHGPHDHHVEHMERPHARGK